MNVSSFSFCLGHEDPAVVIRGLDSFSSQVLGEHDAIDTFGYCGRGLDGVVETSLEYSSKKKRTTGLLAAYLRASSNCEELFTLWGVPGRDDAPDLCASHMRCFAVILHCTSLQHQSQIDNIVNRVIHERGKSLIHQLNSSEVALIHNTLGLLVAMLATSPQNCKTVYHKLLSFNMPTLGNAAQKGKAVTWKHPHREDVTLASCGRHLTSIIIWLLARSGDGEIVTDLLFPHSLLRKLSNSIARTHEETTLGVLRMLMAILSCDTAMKVALSSRNGLIDAGLQTTLLKLLEHEGEVKVLRDSIDEEKRETSKNMRENEIRDTTERLLLQYCAVLSSTGSPSEERVVGRFSRAAAMQLIKELNPAHNIMHKRLEASLLRGSPGLIDRSLAAMAGPWEPGPAVSLNLLASLSHLCHLVNTVEIAGSHKTSLRSLASEFGRLHAAEGQAAAEAKVAVRVTEAVDSLLLTVLPPSLHKKDLTRIVQSKSALEQKMGLLYCKSALEKLKKTIRQAGVTQESSFEPFLEAALSKALHRAFPDFQTIVNVRGTFIKAMATSPKLVDEGHSPRKRRRRDSAGKEEEEEEEEKEEEEEEEIGAPRTSHLLDLANLTIEQYVYVGPSTTMRSSFDLVRLLDDIVAWPVSDSASSAGAALSVLPDRVGLVKQTLDILRLGTDLGLCRWLGSPEEFHKTFSNVLVSVDWRASVKRSALSKLMLLAASKSHNDVVSNNARGILACILEQSSLFLGHGHVDYEMKRELSSWLDGLHQAPEDILVLEVILKFAYHHVFQLSSQAAEHINEIVASKGSGLVRLVNTARLMGAPLYLVSLGHGYETEGEASTERFDGHCLPFSPLLLGALHLACGDCGILVDVMPTHIKGRLQILQTRKKASAKDEEETRAFFEKYSRGFQRSVKSLLLRCASACALDARNGRVYSILTQVLALRAETYASLPSMLGTPSVSEELSTLVAHFGNENSLDILLVGRGKGKDLDLSACSPELFPHVHSPETFYGVNATAGTVALTREWMYSAFFYFHRVHTASPSPAFLSSLCQRLRHHRAAVAAGNVSSEEACWCLCQLMDLYANVCTAIEGIGTSINVLPSRSRRRPDTMSVEPDPSLYDLSSQCHAALLELVSASMADWSTLSMLHTKIAVHDTWVEDSLQKRRMGSSLCELLTSAATLWTKKADLVRGNLHPLWYSVARQVAKLGTSAKNGVSIYTLQCLLQRLSVYDLSGEMKSVYTTQDAGEGDLPQILQIEASTTTQQHGSNNQYLLVLSQSMDQMHRTLVLSMGKGMLERSLASYTANLGGGTSSALCHSLVGVKIMESNPPVLENYCDLLSLVDLLPYIKDLKYVSSMAESASSTDAVDSLSRVASLVLDDAATRHALVRGAGIEDRGDNARIKVAKAALLLMAVPRPAAPSSLRNVAFSRDALEGLSSALLLLPNAAILSQNQYLSSRNNAKTLLLALLPQLESDAPCLVGLFAACDDSLSLCWLALVAQEQQNSWPLSKREFTIASSLVLLHVTLVSIDSFSAQAVEKVTEAWVRAFLECIEGLFTSAVTDMKAGSVQASSLNSILHLLSFDSSDSAGFRTVRKAMSEDSGRLREKLNKFIRGSLKHGLNDNDVVKALINVILLVNKAKNYSLLVEEMDKPGEKVMKVPLVHLLAEDSDLFQATTLMRMLVSHSKYVLVLEESQAKSGSMPCHVVQMLHCLVVSQQVDRKQSSTSSELAEAEIKLAVDSLRPLYAGSMCDRDRVILRIFHLLNALYPKYAPSVAAMSVKGVPNSRDYAAEWIFQAVGPSTVYPTLADFPLWRSLVPQPFLLEGRDSLALHRHKLGMLLDNLASGWTAGDNVATAQEIDKEEMEVEFDEQEDEVEEDGSDDSDQEGGSDVDGEEEDDEDKDIEESEAEATPMFDTFELSSSTHVLDPCFWLPAIHTSLHNSYLPVRQLANSGVLSVVVASLGSCCPLLRAYALSCLAKVSTLLSEQTPAKYPGFRERPQLITLVNFVRNSLTRYSQDTHDSPFYKLGGKVCPRFPPTVSSFLARASLHIMQPGHELYGPLNKYLLSRPYCDPKDVPLFDMLVLGGDMQKELHEKLACLRLLRDSLVSRIDHLNLCRKHAYPRLLAMLAVPAADVRISHAIFDVLEKAMIQRQASRYIIERCGIIAWLAQIGSPVSSLGIKLSKGLVKGGGVGVNLISHLQDVVGEQEQSCESVWNDGMLSISSRLLTRTLSLLRRIVAASYLLIVGDGASLPLQELRATLNLIVDEVLLIHKHGQAPSIPRDYYRQLILLMWDCAIAQAALGHGGHQRNWHVSVVASLASAVESAFGAGNVPLSVERSTIVASLISILSLNQGISALTTDSSELLGALWVIDRAVGTSLDARTESGVTSNDVTYMTVDKTASSEIHSMPLSPSPKVYYNATHLAALGTPAFLNRSLHTVYADAPVHSLPEVWSALRGSLIETVQTPFANAPGKRTVLLLKSIQQCVATVGWTELETDDNGLGAATSQALLSLKQLARWTLCINIDNTQHRDIAASSEFENKVSDLTASIALGKTALLPISVRLAICCMTSYAIAHFLEETELYAREVALLMRALAALLNTTVPSSRSHLSNMITEEALSHSLQSLWESTRIHGDFASSVVSLCEVTTQVVSFCLSSEANASGDFSEVPPGIKDAAEDLVLTITDYNKTLKRGSCDNDMAARIDAFSAAPLFRKVERKEKCIPRKSSTFIKVRDVEPSLGSADEINVEIL